jgi:DNA segregation ATPase FtsK/SpoIIIE-like protein
MTGTPEKPRARLAYEAWLHLAYDTTDTRPWPERRDDDRKAWEAAVDVAAAPLEQEIADLRAQLAKVRDMAQSWTEIDDQWGEPTAEAKAEAEYGRQMLALLGEPDAETAPAATAEHVCVFAPGLPGPCECGNTYADEQVRQSLSRYVATRAGSFVTASQVQRNIRIGYARAARELDRLAAAGMVGPFDADGRYPVPHVPAEPGK